MGSPQFPPPQGSYGPPPASPQYGPPGYQPGGGPYGGPPPVRKPIGWFIVNWLFFWPLAIYSLVSAWQNIDPAMYAGDTAGAQRQADRVRKFGMIALGIGVAWIVLVIVLAVVGAASGVNDCTNTYSC